MESALMVVSSSMIGDYFHGAKRDRLNTLQVGLPAAVGFVMNIVGGLTAEHGWRTPYGVYAISLLLAPLMVIYLWEPVHARREKTAQSVQHQDPPFRPALLAGICLLGMVTGLVYLVLPVNFGYLLEGLPGSSTTAIGTAYGLNSLGAVTGALVFGWVLAPRTAVGTQLGVAAGIAAAGFLMMSGAGTYGAMTAAGVVNGLGCGILLPALVTWTQRSIPAAKRGLGNGAFQSALYLGMSTSPLLVVGLQSMLGGRLAAVSAIGTALAVLAGLAMLYAALTGPMKANAAATE